MSIWPAWATMESASAFLSVALGSIFDSGSRSRSIAAAATKNTAKTVNPCAGVEGAAPCLNVGSSTIVLMSQSARIAAAIADSVASSRVRLCSLPERARGNVEVHERSGQGGCPGERQDGVLCRHDRHDLPPTVRDGRKLQAPWHLHGAGSRWR